MKCKKVLTIGLDGATFDYIFPLIQKGKLPNIKRLIKNGVWGYLRTTFPPITGSAWPSFMTGKTPAKHGVFDFIQQSIKEDVSLVNSRSIDGETIFDMLSRHNKKVIAINVPVTYPPWKINGIMITGMLSPENGEITYPPELKAELGDYRVDIRTSYKEGKEQEMIDDLEELLVKRTKLTKRLLKEQDWDFAMVVFRGTDLIPHYFRKYMDKEHPKYPTSNRKFRGAIDDIYEKTDSAIGELLEIVPKDTAVFLMSDHGHGRLRKMINLNIWLLQNGFLALKKTPRVRIRYNLFKFGFTPQNVYNVLSRLGIQNIIPKFSRQARNKILNSILSFSAVDWSRTKAYSLGHIGQIYINLRGREKFGIVSRGGEYESVRNEIIEKLMKLEDPETNQRVINKIVKKEEYYTDGGPYLDKMSDLFVFTKGHEYESFALLAMSPKIFSEHFKKQSGWHNMEGIFVAYGNEIKSGVKVDNPKIYDIAPTVLYTMGLPIPYDIDGNLLKGIFKPKFLKENNVIFEKAKAIDKGDDMTGDDQKEIRERLKNLGYLG